MPMPTPLGQLLSYLFVPGHNPAWIDKAKKYGAGALILDLEDAVPYAEKAAGRRVTAAALDNRHSDDPPMFVRLNGWGNGDLLADLTEIARPGLAGVFLAKTATATQIRALDLVLQELEARRGIPVGSIEIVPLPETAAGMRSIYELCTASKRVRRTGGVAGAAPGGDRYRSIGTTWTPEGLESLFTTSKAVVDARAAGVSEILCGPVTAIADLDAARLVWTRARNLGATSAMCIHPSHIALLNEVFAPALDDIERAVEVVRAMAAAIDAGQSATRHRGEMIDYAHVRTALELLDRAAKHGLPVPEYPTIDLE
jgi:citrate lyase subunit beta/citryl-CoA lyase